MKNHRTTVIEITPHLIYGKDSTTIYPTKSIRITGDNPDISDKYEIHSKIISLGSGVPDF